MVGLDDNSCVVLILAYHYPTQTRPPPNSGCTWAEEDDRASLDALLVATLLTFVWARGAMISEDRLLLGIGFGESGWSYGISFFMGG
jgi:hypothetical protein